MTTILDTVVLFISLLGEVKRSTDLLAFMELTFGIFFKMHVPIDVSYLRFKELTLSYLMANDIVYRIKS